MPVCFSVLADCLKKRFYLLQIRTPQISKNYFIFEFIEALNFKRIIMKKALLVFGSLALLSFTCCKKEKNKRMTFIKDCTGSYVRLDGKDYHICNIEKVSTFSDGDPITASFKKISDCTALKDQVVCMMYHENEGWVEIYGVQ